MKEIDGAFAGRADRRLLQRPGERFGGNSTKGKTGRWRTWRAGEAVLWVNRVRGP
jgi:hypothetical protein